MTIEKTVQGWRVYGTKKGVFINKHFIGYTKRQAVDLFKKA
jgi:hypothetical protein